MNWKLILVNGLTILRIILCPVLLWMLIANCQLEFASYLLAFAFLTDLLDGYLARRLKVTSDLGCKLDSVADDLLFCVSILYIKYLFPEVISDHVFAISAASGFFFTKMFLLWFRYRKFISGMHTYLTKAAAFLQAVFFIQAMFFGPWEILFKIAMGATILALVEEIVIIITATGIQQNCKGIFLKQLSGLFRSIFNIR